MQYKLKEVVIEITKQCNLNCLHCGSECGFSKDANEITAKAWKQCLLQLSKMDIARVIFSGGESTLKKGIEEIIRFTKEIGLKYSLITNGLHLPQTLKKVFLDYPAQSIGISIDGMKQTHNLIRQNNISWQNAINNIYRLRQDYIKVCIITTVNKMNLSELPVLAELLESLDVNYWQIQLAEPFGRMLANQDLLIDSSDFLDLCRFIYESRKTYPTMKIEGADCFGWTPKNVLRDTEGGGCSAGISSIGINASGKVMPCLSLRNTATCGNILETPIKQIWEESKTFDFNRKFKKESVSGNCYECRLLDACRGGCSSMSFSHTGTYHKQPFCLMQNTINGGKK